MALTEEQSLRQAIALPRGCKDELVTLLNHYGSKLVIDDQRNSGELLNHLIFNDVLQVLEEGRSPIVLTERKEHLEHFASQFRNFTPNLIVLQGGKTAKKRRKELIEKCCSNIKCTTGSYISLS